MFDFETPNWYGLKYGRLTDQEEMRKLCTNLDARGTIRISSSTNKDERTKIESRARIVREGSVI
uniref:Uncharacterized protein n=1 Tax=Helianthus annuus TaxID=4232 RepID=A0A251UGM6_HELAN